MRFYKAAPADVVVFYDEIDLAPGRFRMKTGGGAAGNNGMRSIAAHIGPDFRRARLGTGHPGHKDLVMGHVLSDFSKAEISDWVRAAARSLRRRVAAAGRRRGRTLPGRGAASGAGAEARSAGPARRARGESDD